MTPTIRFTLFHATLAPSGLVIPQPDGWKNSQLVLERHPDFHSLVETFQGEFVFWGSGMRFLQAVEELDGPDATVRILIEISYKINVFQELFDGLLDISEMEEINIQAKKYKYKVPIIRNDFWAKFINRKSTKVDLLSTVDVDGNARTLVDKFTLPMPSQIIMSRHHSKSGQTFSTLPFPPDSFVDLEDKYIQVQMDEVQQDEVKDIFNYPSAVRNTVPVAVIKPKFEGTYELDVRFRATFLTAVIIPPITTPPDCGTAGYHGFPVDTFVKFYAQKNDETPIEFAFANSSIILQIQYTDFTSNETFNLLKEDEIKIYGQFQSGAVVSTYDAFVVWGKDRSMVTLVQKIPHVFPSSPTTCDFLYVDPAPIDISAETSHIGDEPSYMRVTANTIFEDTSTDALLIGDAAENILSKLVGADNVMVSDTFDNCKGLYAIMKGLHQRGYDMTSKPMFMAFMDWWEGINPILKLGLGYEEVLGVDKIRIERREYFYNKSATSINLTAVANAVRTYDLDLFMKQVEVGYAKWSAESESGIDDPQTKRTYRTKFAKIGKDEKLLSKFIAASLAIEQTRRNRVEFGKDWRLDEDVMIIALKLVEGDYVPEVGTDFQLITNLLNSDTRINVRLSSARNFERWRNWFNGCLAHLTGEKFYFASGEGNFDMVSTLFDADCDEGANNELSEKQDIDADPNDFIILPIKREFKHAFGFDDYSIVRDNRELAIGVNLEGDDYQSHFIKRLAWAIMGGYANFTLNLASKQPEDQMLFQDGVTMAFQDGVEMKYN